MAFERIRSIYDTTPEDTQSVDRDATNQPQEVSNPHTLPDETRKTLGERIAEHKVQVAAYSVFAIVVGLVLFIWGRRFLATTISNTYVQLAAYSLFLVAVSGHMMYKRGQASLDETDEVALHNPDTGTTTRYLADLKQSKYGDYWYFIPYKGTGRGGYGTRPYTAGDLNQDMPDNIPAKIRLQPGDYSGVAPTNTGMIAVQTTDGIEPDPRGEETNFVATIPDQASKATVTDLKDTIQSLDQENENLQRRNNMLRRQRNDLAEEGSKTRDEIRDEVQEQVVTIGSVVSGRRVTRSDDGDSDDIRDDLDQLKEALNDD